MTEHRPIWQDGGIHGAPEVCSCARLISSFPCPVCGETCGTHRGRFSDHPWLRGWEHKMDPWTFDMNGRVRRAYRTTYSQRLGRDVTVLLGVVAFCAVVWWAVWGVMA